MKLRIVLLLSLVVVIVLLVLGVLRVPSITERRLAAAYAQLDDAMRRKDLPAYMALLTPDYSETRFRGKPASRHEAEKRYRQLMTDWTFGLQDADILRFTEQKDRVVAIVDRHSEGTVIDSRGAFGPKGKVHRIVSSTTDVDTWVRTPRGLRLKLRQTGLGTVSVDGKALGMPIVAPHDH